MTKDLISKSQSIAVSICCITFNHEKYIARAIESFLKQKTTFNFEILIHDDASTDDTQQIISEYKLKFPNIIKTIYQETNQFSKGIQWVEYEFLYPIAQGKYIAICEGDDFWIDQNKLQMQYEYMENNEDCTLCFHNAIVVDKSGKLIKKSFLPKSKLYEKYYKRYNSKYSINEMILLDFIPTNSLFLRKKDTYEMPSYYFNQTCGDLPMRLYFSSIGYAYYHNLKCSAYTRGVENSASQQANLTLETKLKTLVGHLEILNEFNKQTMLKFDKEIEQSKEMKKFSYLLGAGDFDQLRSIKYKKLYDELSLLFKFKLQIRKYMPNFYTWLKKVFRK